MRELLAAGAAAVAVGLALYVRGRRAGLHKLTYFGIYGKGPAPALALAHSGLEYQISFPDAWSEMKPKTPWGHLPVLEMPSGLMIGHEMSILNFIGMTSAKMGGRTDVEFVISQQLMCQAEDIYQKLTKMQNTIMETDKVTKDELDALWASADTSGHNKNNGIPAYLSFVEKLPSAEDGRFTTSGVSVGECKLFAVLHTMVSIRDDVLAPFPKLSAFYARFGALEPTKSMLAGTLPGMPGPFKPYFIA